MERLDDRYDLVETVSGHGRGQVIKAWDRERARHVALKVFRIDDDEQRERVLLEAELLMRVPAHPNLAVIVDELLVEQTYALVHDWVDGPDLAVVLRSSGSTGLPLDEVLRDIGQVAAALDHLHAQRPAVVHGDVKPANVVRAFGGRVVLVDFGSSVLEGGRGRSGTPGYAAPELQRGDGMTPASDVYGLTATVVTLLSGESPSGAAPSLDGLNVDVAASVAAVLRAGMADDPRLRPASAGALVEQLRRAADPATRPDRRTAVLAVVADGSAHTGEDGRSHPGPTRADRVALRQLALLMAELAEEHGGFAAALGTASRAQRAAAAILPDARAAVAVLERLRAELPGRVGPAWTDQAVRAAVHVGPVETDIDPAVPTVAEALWLVEQVPPGKTALTEPAAAQLISRLGRAEVMVDLGLVHLPRQRRPERVFGLGTPGAAFRLGASGPARASDAPTNLTPPTRLVGRDVELADLVRLAVGQRLCTVTGAPGIGKSRVAQECAAHVSGGFPDGVWQVDLRSTPGTVDAVARAVLAVSGGDTGSGTLVAGRRSDHGTATARLTRRLRGRALLLLLDNCDGAMTATADVIRSVVDACPGVHVLVTSRTALGLEVEAVLRLTPLSLPSPRQPRDTGRAGSTQLLVHLLTQDRPGLELGADDLDAIADICTLVDGVPLAIELAAARSPGLGLREIADSLRGLGSPLAAEDATRDALAWITRSLPQHAQRLLRRLSVFAGGFSADAANGVCGDDDSGQASVSDALAVLVARSLVEADEASGSIRYRLLSSTREHAGRLLAESGEAWTLERRHALWFADVAARAEAGGRGPDQLQWLDAVDADLGNLSVALDVSIRTRQPEQALWTAARLGVYWLVRGRAHEGRTWLAAALASSPSEPSPARSWARCATGLLACFGGDPVEAVSASVSAIRDARACAEPGAEARSSSVLGLVAAGEGRMGEAERLHGVAVRIARGCGDDWAAAFALANLGNPLSLRGDTRAARACYEESLELRRSLGDRYGISWSTYRLGCLLLSTGDPARARSLLLESWEVATELHFAQGCINAALGLGRLMSATSHPVAASGWFAEALERAEANEDGASRTLALAGLVECAAVRHRETEFVQWSSQLASTGAESTVGTQVAALLARAAVADADGDQTLACEARVASLVGLRWLHDRAGTHEQLDQLALYAAAAGDWAQAAFLVTATAKDRQGTGLVVPLRHAAAVGRLQRRVERSSDPVVLAARRAGRASTLGRAAAVAATAHRAGHPVLLATEGWP